MTKLTVKHEFASERDSCRKRTAVGMLSEGKGNAESYGKFMPASSRGSVNPTSKLAGSVYHRKNQINQREYDCPFSLPAVRTDSSAASSGA